MKILIQRYSLNDESTLGLLFVNGEFQCYTIEDTYNKAKVYGKTRIPSGIYMLKLRNEGGMVKKYNTRFNNHRGMLHLQNVKDFQYVYIHVGNKSEDSEGCVLVGNQPNNNQRDKGFIGDSATAYQELYNKINNVIDNEVVYVEVRDELNEND